jgi:hypothetical protein
MERLKKGEQGVLSSPVPALWEGPLQCVLYDLGGFRCHELSHVVAAGFVTPCTNLRQEDEGGG